MIVYVTLGALILAGMFGCGMLAGHQIAVRQHSCPPQIVLAPMPVSQRVQLLEDAVRIQNQRIAMLESLEVVPVSPWVQLPWQQVPSPSRTFWVQGIIDTNQELRAEVAQLESDVTYFADLAAKRWKWLKMARTRLRELTPVAAELPLLYSDFERECSLKDAYHEKARSFAERITTAREAIASEAMRDEIDSILAGYTFPATQPIGVAA